MERRRTRAWATTLTYWLAELGLIVLLLLSVSLLFALAEILSGRAHSLGEVLWPETGWLDYWAYLLILGLVAFYALAMVWRLYRAESMATDRTMRLGKALGHLSLARQSSERDPLTGALTRKHLEARLTSEEAISRGKHQPLSVIMMDIDHFKHINDTYGHAAGDEILKQFVSTASAFLRSTDQFYRYGGEEFLLLMPNTQASTAAMVAERFRAALMRSAFNPVNITASFGVAQLRDDEVARHMVERADAALYRAKGDGRNRVLRGD